MVKAGAKKRAEKGKAVEREKKGEEELVIEGRQKGQEKERLKR